MEIQKFLFEAIIKGQGKKLTISVPVKNGFAITNHYCPQDILTGGIPFVSAINGESIDEFITDCQKQIKAMKDIRATENQLDIHIAGLMAAVMDHLNRCGRLIFGDLLIYMDCFSHLLAADGFGESEITGIYPRITRTIVELYPNKVFNTIDLSPFKGSFFDFILYNVSRN